MRRNVHTAVGYRDTDARASLGDFYVAEAIAAINTLQQRAAATMVHYNLSREATLPMLFHDTDLAKLGQVRGMVKPSSTTQEYDLGQCHMTISFDEALVPTIQPECLHIQPQRWTPLLEAMNAIKAVHLQYEEVKGVLKWLNRNATPGAIRFYWPTAMKLVPTSPMWKDLQEVPSRYTVPDGIASWTQALKDAANTVAASAMLPSDVFPRKREKLWLTFKTEGVHLDMTDPNKVHYGTDQIVYNL